MESDEAKAIIYWNAGKQLTFTLVAPEVPFILMKQSQGCYTTRSKQNSKCVKVTVPNIKNLLKVKSFMIS